MDKPKDYYLILGVPRDASDATIRRAYQRLSRRRQAEAASDFTDVQVAYETLVDADRRRRYDDALVASERDDFAPLAWSFVRSPAVGGLRRPVTPGSLSGEVLLTPEEAELGGVMSLDIPVTMQCPSCEGTGGAVFDCDRCAGAGSIKRRLPVPLRIPAGVRDGAVFQVTVDDPSLTSVVLTVHIRAL